MEFHNILTRGQYSRRHHYLPVFYLKGFADEDKLICVYDKVNDMFLSKQKPESKFYEKDLNNYRVDGKVKFTLEEPLFTPIDTKISELFVKIRKQELANDEKITPLEQFQILSFISSLFWRSPESNKIFVDIIKKDRLFDKYFRITKNSGSDFVSDQEIDAIKMQIFNDEEKQKVLKYLISFSSMTIDEISRLYYKWNVIPLKITTPNIITGDRPFLINNDKIRFGNIFNELIFPIGKYKLLMLSDKSPNFLDGNLMNMINLSILHQSKRFIASDSEEQLKQLVSCYNKLRQLNLHENLIKETFEVMHYQSTFKDFSDYYKAYEEGNKG